jgi:hypothetical protein
MALAKLRGSLNVTANVCVPIPERRRQAGGSGAGVMEVA